MEFSSPHFESQLAYGPAIGFPSTWDPRTYATNVQQEDSSSVANLIYQEPSPNSSREDDNEPSGRPTKAARLAYRCEACAKSYTERRALARHRHSDLHRRNTGLPMGQKYPCPTCGKNFNRNHDRTRHENEMHKGLKRAAQTKRDEGATSDDGSQKSRPNKRSNSDRGTGCLEPFNGPQQCMTSPEMMYWSMNPQGGQLTNPWLAAAGDPRTHHMLIQQQGSNWSDISSVSPKGMTPSVKTPSVSSGSRAPPPNLQEQSWIAEESSESEEEELEEQEENDEDDSDDSLDALMEDTPVSQLSLRTISSAGDSAIDMSQDHETKYPTILTFDYRDDKSDKMSISTTGTSGTTGSSTASRDVAVTARDTATIASRDSAAMPPPPLPPKTSVIVQNGKTKTIGGKETVGGKDTPYCIFCKTVFEEDMDDLLPHLRKHLDSLKNEKFCKTCKVGFTHKADLDKHLINADKSGHCGFGFEHKRPCTGHHPPGPDQEKGIMTDWDAVRMCAQLRNWEQAQLHAYMSEVRNLTAARAARTSNAYSIEALMARRSRDSFGSFAISVNTFGSAPCDIGADGITDVGGLQQRMRFMSIKGGSTPQIKAPTKKGQHVVRSGTLEKAMHSAASTGNVQQIELLTKLGGLPNSTFNEQTMLCAAAQHSNVETMETLIDLGANLHAIDGRYGCPLSSAAFGGKMDNVHFLLENGADINQHGGKFGSPLGAAAANGSVELINLFLAQGANIRQSGGEFGNPFNTAVAAGNLDATELMMDRGADLEQQGGELGAPLGHAVWNGHLDILGFLILQGANVNGSAGEQDTPLCAAIVRMATGHGLSAIVDYLIEKGAEVNFPAANHGSALKAAAGRGDTTHMPKVIKTLIKHGAVLNARDFDNGPLSAAKKRRQHWIDKKLFTELLDEQVNVMVDRCDNVVSILREAGAVDEDERMQAGKMVWRVPRA